MTLKQFARIVEIRTKVVSLSSFAIGTLYAVGHTGTIDWTLFALMLAAVLCVDMGTTAFNTFYDFVHGVDTKPFNLEQDKVLVHEGVGAGTAFLVSAGLFALAMVLGIVIAVAVGFEIILLGAASMAVGYLYNGGPLPISRTPVGELFAGGFLGWLLVALSYYVQSGTLTAEAALIGLPSLLLVASILTVNNTCDMEGDRAAGRKTLSILIGRRASEAVIYGLGLAAYGTAAAYSLLGLLPRLTLLPLALAAVVSFRAYARMHAAGYSHATKGPSMRGISRVFLAYSAAVVLGLLYAAVS